MINNSSAKFFGSQSNLTGCRQFLYCAQKLTLIKFARLWCLTDLFVGWPGHTHDARVLANSPLYRKAEDQGGYLFPHDVSKDVEGVEVPAHLVGDAAYPLRSWLMKGFTQQQVLDQDQQRFNKALNSATIVMEHAFGHLKGRWQCLSERLDISTTLVPDVVFAFCVLHNICEVNKEDFPSEWTLVEADDPAPNSADCADQQGHGHQAIRSAIMSIL
ncbi:putative nuclease HARBI1 [Narcine bancroftii]|uniref:putative nuclease HARBI1 n=1 Tax=Narcine bancroftii TaxID=1343680 RepID=UPI003831771E